VMDLPALSQQLHGGKLRPLAVTSPTRVEFLPDVPTAIEQGLKGFQSMNWIGVFAPAKTPAAIIDRLNAALVKVVAMPDFRKQLTDAAVSPSTMANPAAFQKFVADEYARWGKVAKDSGATMD
jgi:tripartite-type tricarboxylate transporter receptor subunit TctC